VLGKIVVAAVAGYLAGFAATYVFCAAGIKTWLTYVSSTKTVPATEPIIVITLLAIFAGCINSLWPKFTSAPESVTEGVPTPSAAKKQKETRRKLRRENVKRKIAFDAILAGVTLALYLVIIMIDESLGDLTDKVALILASLPGAIGFCHHVFAVGLHFTRRQTTVEAYKTFRERYDQARRGDTESSSPLDEMTKDEPEDYIPPLPQTFFASLLITAVLLVPASMTTDPDFLKLEPPAAGTVASGAQGATTSRTITEQTTVKGSGDQTTTTKTTTEGATIAPPAGKQGTGTAAAAAAKDPRSESQIKGRVALVNGIFFAGLGAYVWALYLLVSRINAAALTSRFLINCAVRTAMGIAIGAGMSVIGPTVFTGGSGWLLLFLIGMLPQWALTTLRNKAKEWFGVKEDGCETLPICLVDGLNDGLIDLLSELGVGDIEHLAHCDPGELTLQTLFPLARVTNWIDQALLIQEVRGDIVNFRNNGISTATSFARLHAEFAGLLKVRAARVIAQPAAPVPSPVPAPVPSPVAAPAPPNPADPATLFTGCALNALPVPAAPYNPQTEAGAIYAALATGSKRSAEALHLLGRRFFDDYFVAFLWNLWNMPGSIWTGWVAELAEWMPAVFNAAETAADSAGVHLIPAASWDDCLCISSTSPDTLSTFFSKFGEALRSELDALDYVLDKDADPAQWFESAKSWRDVVKRIFPQVQPKARC
jgi:hypothetical protein